MYNLILTDCPWQYDNLQQNDPKRGGITYPTMTMKELYETDVGSLADSKSCMLVCWVTFPKLFDEYYEQYSPLSIIRNWGFRPVTTLFVWVKTNKKATVPDYEDDELSLLDFNGYYSGLGRYTNSNVEIAIVARMGKAVPRLDKTVKQLIVAPIGMHSAKPQEQYDRLQRLWGDIPRIELFARKQNPPPSGWHGTGLEYDGLDIRDFIHKQKGNNV